MNEELEMIKETAKATQEVSKTTSKAIDVAQNLCSFIARIIGGTLEQGAHIFEDKLKYMRWERQQRFMQRVNELEAQVHKKPIPPKLAVPLLQAASLEDDNFLQDMWAKLLVNSETSK